MILPSSLLAELADICKLLVSDAVIVAPPSGEDGRSVA